MNTDALDNLLKTNPVSKDTFIQNFKNIQNNKVYSDGSIFASSYTENQLEDIYSKFDTNGDGQIDRYDTIDEETFSEENMSQEDLNLFVEGLNSLLQMQQALSSSFPASTGASEASSGSSSGGGYPSVQSGDDSSTPAPENNNSGEKNYSSMTADELKTELESANNSLTQNQNELNNITDGSNSELTGLKEDINKKEEAYQQKMNEVAPELAKEYETAKTDLDTHKQNIDNQNVIINTQKAKIESLSAEVNGLQSQIASYDEAISALQSKTGTEEETEGLSGKISELEKERDEAKAKMEAKQAELTTLQETELPNAQAVLAELENQTPIKEQALQTIQGEIDKLNNEELTTLKGEVETAQSAYDDKKTALKTEAEKNVNEAKEKVASIQEELKTKQTEEIKSKADVYNPTELYNSLGLKEQGLSFENFNFMLEGYKNLEDKGNGRVSLVDEVNHNCYVIDMNSKKLIGKYRVSTGHKQEDIDKANQANSYHATPGGWLKVGNTHYGRKYNGNAMTLIGLEDCNKNTESRAVIAHHIDYGIGYNTWGCLGFKEKPSTIKNEIMQTGTMVCVIKAGMIQNNSKYKKQSRYYST